nr:WASH complex subunit 3 isoform X2 [Chrysemys picta bellii]
MDEDGLPLVGSGIDLTKKLSALSLRIQQIETTLNILDAKLSSIPGLEDVKFEVSSANINSVTNGPVPQASTDQHSVSVSPQSEQNNIHEIGQQKTEAAAENVMTVAKDPRYARYLKMVQVGVPVMAIRNKMISEGLDPDLLECNLKVFWYQNRQSSLLSQLLHPPCKKELEKRGSFPGPWKSVLLHGSHIVARSLAWSGLFFYSLFLFLKRYCGTFFSFRTRNQVI